MFACSLTEQRDGRRMSRRVNTEIVFQSSTWATLLFVRHKSVPRSVVLLNHKVLCACLDSHWDQDLSFLCLFQAWKGIIFLNHIIKNDSVVSPVKPSRSLLLAVHSFIIQVSLRFPGFSDFSTKPLIYCSFACLWPPGPADYCKPSDVHTEAWFSQCYCLAGCWAER